MKWFLFFILMGFCSCHGNEQNKNIAAAAKVDSIIPTIDTAIVRYSEYDRVSDSITRLKLRDSFYAIKPIYTFITNRAGESFNQLVGSLIDTSPIKVIQADFKSRSIIRYDKNQEPISEETIINAGNYKIILLDTSWKNGFPKRLYINGKELRPGIEIDTTNCFDEYFICHLQFDEEKCYLFKFKEKTFLYLEGYVENCNGNGCGVSYHLIYDPSIQKAVAVQQYRRYNKFVLGGVANVDDLCFLSFADGIYNELFTEFPSSAKLFAFSKKGKVISAKDKQGNQYYCDGYFIDNSDSIFIKKANFYKKAILKYFKSRLNITTFIFKDIIILHK